MHAMWEKRLDWAAHIANVELHQGNAPCHTTRNTLLEIDVLRFKRAIHQPYSTDLAPLDFVYFPNLKSYLGGTRFNHSTNICHAIQKCNRPEMSSTWHYYDGYRRSCDVGLLLSCVHGVI